MNTEAIYKLAEEITKEEILNTIEEWKLRNEKEKLRNYNSLVRLGDSEELAYATVMLSKPIDKETEEFYRFAYEN